MTNEQIQIDEQLQEIFDSCADDVPDMHLIYGRAVWQAATAKVDQQETKAWLIQWECDDLHHGHVFTHNAIGDYRDLYKDATVTELVRRLPLPPTGIEKDKA